MTQEKFKICDKVMKAYTDIEQSRKLAEILPPESADMYWDNSDTGGRSHTIHIGKSIAIERNFLSYKLGRQICAWSLAALLSILPKVINNETLFIETSPALWHIGYRNIYTARADNVVDACYEMILKLNEKKML